MTDKELAEFLSDKSDEVMHHVSRDFMSELHKDDLSVNQYAVLRELDAAGDLSMGHLAGILGVSAPAITVMIDKLERGRYAHRIRDNHDRRKVNVALTEKGRDAISKVRKARLRSLNYLLSRMTDKEKDSWASLYGKIVELLRERTRESGPA